MSITIPASPDCQECSGKGQTIGADGFTKACQTCWREIVGRVAAQGLGQLQREDIERKAFEKAACITESLQGNPTYTQAWRLAARAIRCAKPD